MSVDNMLGRSRDPREKRTLQRLTDAVLALAAEQDITQVSVAELTRRAEINRSTFYAFAASPVEWLTSVLHAELDAARRVTTNELSESGSLTRDIMRQTLSRLLDHVERHQSVYTGTQRSSSRFALRIVLAEHVENSVLQAFHDGFIDPPVEKPTFESMSASFLGHGIAGLVEVWMRLPAPRDRLMLFNTLEEMYPVWFAPKPAGFAGEAPRDTS
ncbi:TetR/AcrR family transcriptional regulator [Agrobacterium deltaense]